MNKLELNSMNLEQLQRKLSREKKPKEKLVILENLFFKTVQNDMLLARSFAEKLLTIATEHKIKAGIAKGNLLLAMYFSFRAQDYKIGIEFAEKGLEIFLQLAETEYIAESYRVLGSANMGLGKMNKAKEYLDKSLRLNIENSNERGELKSLQTLGIYYGRKGDFQKLKDISQEMYDRSVTLKDTLFQSSGLSNLATAADKLGEPNESIKLHEKNIILKKKLGDLSGEAYCLMGIGQVHEMLGNHELALIKFIEAKKILTSKFPNLKNLIHNVHINLSICYHKLGRTEEALEEASLSLKVSEEMGDEYYKASALRSIGNIKVINMNDDSGFDEMNTAVEVSRKIESSESLAGCLSTLCFALVHNCRYKQALEYAKEGLDISIKTNLIDSQCDFLCITAQCKYHLKKYKEALKDSMDALKASESIGHKSHISDCHQLLADIYVGLDDYKTAYLHLQKHYKLKDELLNLNTSHRIQGLFVQFDVDRAKKESEMKQLENEKLQIELDMKQKELSSLALHLVNKNEFLQDLKEQISNDIISTNNIVKEVARRIDTTVNQDNDWELFEKQFIAVNPSFSAKLAEISGSKLSTTEVKICSLIRTGLSTKEIASMLFLSQRTVENHRYNIQKKLNINGSIKLNSFLMGL